MTRTFKKQTKTFGPRTFARSGNTFRIKAFVRFDDECGNGHNTFSITGEIHSGYRFRTWDAGDCLHDEIAEHFPELAPYIKWHLTSSDGPMYYLDNTMYLASDKDCWGYRKGEPKDLKTSIYFGDNPIKHMISKQKLVAWLRDQHPKYDLEVVPFDHKSGEKVFTTKYTFGGFGEEWYQCPFDHEDQALDFLYALQNCDPQYHDVYTGIGEGKEPDLEAARSAACWPDATLEQLQSKEILEARLEGLLSEFRKDVEALGFQWEPDDEEDSE